MLRKLIIDCHSAGCFDKAYSFIYLFIHSFIYGGPERSNGNLQCLTPLGHCTFGIYKVVLFTSTIS